MKKSLILLMVIFGIVSLHAQAMEFLKLREQQITPEVLNQIARNNAQVRGPSFDFDPVPYNLPDAVDLADPGTGKFYEDIPWTKDFTRHIVNSGGGPLYLYYSSPEHFNVSQPDPGNPFLLKFEPIPTHWHGSELMVLTVSDQPLDRGSTRASSTAIIRINVTSVPDPPVFNLPPANRFFTDENVPITLNFRDYVQCIDSAWDNFDLFVMQTQDPINVMVSQAPNPASGHLVTFTPHPHYNSPLGVRFLVTAVDRASNGFSSIEMILVIHPINDPPEIVSYFPTDLDLVINQDETQHFEVNAIDVDGDILTHSWTLEGTINGLPYSQVIPTTTELDHQFPHPGVFTLTYKAKDDWLEDSITWTITVKPIGPIFSPVPDPYQPWFTHGVAITLSLPTGYEGATIYYTTDGSIPQIGAPGTLIYEQPIDIPTLPNIENIKTIRAFFLHPTIPPASQVLSNRYRITGQVADPIFNPTGGSYYSQVSLNISCPNLSATIYYTTDGNDPVPGAPNTYEYSGPFTTDTYMVVKAIAVRDDWIDSNIVVHTYNVTGVVMINSLVLDPPPPPDGDFYDVDIGDHLYLRVASMNITPEDTATLYYLLVPTPFDDDTLPGPDNHNSIIYTPRMEIPLNCPTIIKFRAFNDDWQPSGTISFFYDVRTRTKIFPFPAPNGSIFDPAPHISTVPLQVYINTVTEPLNAPIYYTTDGSDPIEDPALRYYGGPINLSQNFHTYTIKVLAHDPAFCPSQIYTGVYEITGAVDTPQFDPVPSSYQNPISVAITTATPGTTIYYTLDGDVPDTGSNLYTTPVALGNGNHILRAIAYKNDWLPSAVRTGFYRIGVLPPPVFNYASGTYTNPIVVHLSSTVPDVTILYSLTGGAPFTAYDPALGIPVAEHQNATITAYASKLGWADSDMVSATYNVTGSVAMPTFNPGGGSYPGVQNVTISCATPGAIIRWTLDGQEPTLTHGNDYSVPVTIAHSATLKARAYFADWAPSAVNSADYTIFGNIAMPVFTPAPGNYKSAVDVHISVNPPTASIYYTDDGSTPDASSTLYTGSPIVIGLNQTKTLKAIAIQSGWNDSDIATGTYNVTGRVATPTFSPAGGSFATPPTVSISTATASASIRYTTDGSDPSETHGEPYSIPIQLTGSTLIKAIAYLADWDDSYINSANYVVNPQVASPIFTPAGGYYSSAQNVSISSYTSGAEIRYTLDGSEPDQLTGLVYSTPIAVDRYTMVRARAYKAEHLDSAISSAEYFFITANPVLAPIAGAYPEPFDITMDSSTAGASFRYTMDGTDPTPTSGIEYTGSFTLNQSATIRAIAYKDGWISSNVVIYSYVINGPVNAPQFSISGGNYYDTLSVSIYTLPSNAAIYYTTNGDDPSDTNGNVYDPANPVQITQNTTLKAKAYLANWLPSPISTAVYNLYTKPVTFSHDAGNHSSAIDVTMGSITPGARIWYTTNNTDPIIDVSTEYDFNPIHIGSDTTFKAIARVDGWHPSPISSAFYDIEIPLPSVATPEINYPSGVYTTELDVEITTTTEDAHIWYTINDPDHNPSNGIQYGGSFTVNTSSTIRASAYKDGYQPSGMASAQYIIVIPIQTVQTPVFSPDAGIYYNSVPVTISSGTPNAHIYYTTDGAEPDNNSIPYTDPITLTSTTNIKAIAYKAGMNTSLINSASYVINVIVPNVDTPVFNYDSGLYHNPIDITITSTTPDAEIWYSLDGSDPARSAPGSVEYTAPIHIDNGQSRFIKARAFKTGNYNPSPVVSANYNVTGTVADVVFSTPGGTYTTPQSLILTTSTPDATIRYTTDGNDPSPGSTPYVTAIAINTTMTVKARAYKTDWLPGNIGSEDYVITGSLAFDQPNLTPPPGNWSNPINVIIADPIPSDAAVWYTLDGSLPSETNGILYTVPIPVDSALTLRAVAIKAGWVEAYVSGDYTFAADAPSFNPPSGSYPNAQLVSLNSSTTGAMIRYTTDGSDPSATNGIVYTAPIIVSINQTVKAYSFKTGYQDSPIVSATYAIGTYVPVVATPLFNPLPGTYSDPFSVAIATSTPGATIRYTTDGSTPDATSDAYTTPIYIGNHTTMTIKAIAFKDEWDDSQMAEGTYIVTGAVQEVSFSPVGGSFTTAQNVTLSTTTAGAAIYYTIDGTDPNENTLPYTQPIVVPLNTTNLTIKARAYKNTWSPSTITSQTYTVTGQVTIPGNVFTPAAGVYTTAQSVTIATVSNPAGATIRYTEDGSDPTATSPVYTGQQIAVPLNTTKTVKARAYLTDWDESPVYSATYTVTGTIAWPATIFSPAAGTYQTAQNITISYPAVPTGTSIYYTLDGSDPSQSSLLYQGPISLPLNSGNTTIKARAYKADWTPSVIATAIYNVTGTVTYMTPVFLPDPSVIYTSPVSVTINQVNPTGATVRYTLDGTEPTQTSPAYTGTINLGLNTTTTIKTKAFLANWTDSQTHTASYTVTGQVSIPAPVFSPAPGTYINPQTITISSSTVPAGAVIRYTTDGTEPTSTSPIYTNPIPAPAYSTTRIKAKAFVTNWLPSPTYEGIYVVNGAAIINGPVFTPPGGTYATAQNLVISQNTLPMDATLYYTTDGTDPSTTNGTLYSDPIHLGLDQTITVKVRAYGNSNWEPSIIHTAVYHITGQVAIPDAVFSPDPASVYTEAQTVTINAPVPANATVYYTTDGSDPDTSSDVYSEPIAIPLNTVMTIKARGYLEYWTPSPIYTATYKVTGKVQLAADLLNPIPGIYTTPQTLTITAPVLPQGAIIRYTITPDLTDPTQAPDPDETSAQYTSPIQIPYDSNWVIKIGGFARDWIDSDVVIAPYTVTGTVQQPQYIINGEEVLEDVLAGEQITLSLISATDDATIYYTTALGADPATPTENDMLFDPDQPIVITELTMDLRIRARAFRNDWVPSDEESFSFTVIPLPYDVRAFTYAGYIRLLWNSDITAKGLDGFNVYRRKLNSSVWTKLNTALVNSKIGIDYYYDDYAIENGVSYVYRITAIYSGIESPYSVTTTIEYQSSELDVNDATHAYPNPASTSTKIKLVLSRNDNVQVAVSIYDYSGKKIRTLTVPSTSSNLIEIPWDLKNSDGKKVGRGTYFARIVANDGVKKAERTIKISVK